MIQITYPMKSNDYQFYNVVSELLFTVGGFVVFVTGNRCGHQNKGRTDSW